MSLFLALVSLCCLISFSCAQSDYAVSHEAIDISKFTLWGKTTYYITFEFPTEGTTSLTVNYAGLLAAANVCYNSVKTQPPVPGGKGKTFVLCACVGITGKSEAFCSTVPRDIAANTLQTIIKSDPAPDSQAPIWEAAVRSLQSPTVSGPQSYWPHAEDLAYINFERGSGLPASLSNMYPDGTTIAVWAGTEPGDQGVGQGYIPCKAQKKQPDCQAVAKKLGVTFAPDDAFTDLLNPQGQSPPNTVQKIPTAPISLPLFGLIDSEAGNFTAKRNIEEPPPLGNTIILPEQVIQDIINVQKNPPAATVLPPEPTDDLEDLYDTPSFIATQTIGTGATTVISSSVGTQTSHTISSAPTVTPLCYLSQESVDGEPVHGCICNGDVYPTLSSTPGASISGPCAYTTLPAATKSVSTYTSNCRACTRFPGLLGLDECTSIPNCLPMTAVVSVTQATSGMHVGTLTGSALYTSVSNALESICPSVTQTTSATQCSGTAIINNIDYVDDGTHYNQGELAVSAAFSSYNVTQLRNAMIITASTATMNSATGDNCYPQSYETVPEVKRWLPRGISSLFSREIIPVPQVEHITLCNTAQLGLVNYYSPHWREGNAGATDYIEVEYAFHQNGGGNFACAITQFALDALDAIAPEYSLEDTIISDTIGFVCEELNGGSSK